MKVLVTIKRSPTQRYLMQLLTKALIREVKNLINSKKHSEAVVVVLTKGKLRREVLKEDLHAIEADLILSEHNASWDIMK